MAGGQYEPCPFCGRLIDESHGWHHETMYQTDEKGNRLGDTLHHIKCFCGASGPWAKSKWGATLAWNGRFIRVEPEE